MTVQCVRAEQDPDHLNSFHEEPLRSCVVGFTGQSDECPTSVDRSIELASLVGDEACREVASTGTGTDSSGGPAEEGSGICRSCPPSSHDAERKCLTQHGKSMGAFGTSAVICKAFMGSVFIFLPYAVVKGGLVLSLLTLGGVMVLSVYCMQLLIDCCVRGTSDTYELIAERALGRWGRVLVEGCVFFSQVAFCTVYVVVAARNLRDVLRSLSSCSPDRDISVTVLIWSLGLYFLPLSFVRNMSYLVPLMLIGNAGTISGMCILCVAVTLHVSGQTGETNSFDFFNFGGWSLILGTSVYVWLGAGLILPIRNTTKPSVQKKFPVILASCLTALLLLYVVYTTICVLAFGKDMKEMILSNLPPGPLGVAIQAIFVIVVLSTYPLMLFPATGIAEERLFPMLKTSTRAVRLLVVAGIRVALVLSTLGFATVGKHQVGSLVSLVGAVCGVPLGFVFPAMIHMRLEKLILWRHVLHCLIIVCGFSIQLFSLYYTISHWKGNPAEYQGSCLQVQRR